jgi:hypothetical protein
MLSSRHGEGHLISGVVYDWLVKYGRLSSPKYLVGESYGGYHAPRIALRRPRITLATRFSTPATGLHAVIAVWAKQAPDDSSVPIP